MNDDLNSEDTQATGLGEQATNALVTSLNAVREGDFTALLPEAGTGQEAEVAIAFNTLCEQLQLFAVAASRLAAANGARGELGTQIPEGGAGGTWKDLTDNLNHMSLILAAQVRDVTQVANAVAEGDLSQKVTVAAAGDMATLKESFNTMIDQLQLLKDSVNALMERVSKLNSPPPANGHRE